MQVLFVTKPLHALQYLKIIKIHNMTERERERTANKIVHITSTALVGNL